MGLNYTRTYVIISEIVQVHVQNVIGNCKNYKSNWMKNALKEKILIIV